MGCGSSQTATVAPAPQRSPTPKNQQTLPKEELVVTPEDGNISRKKKKNVLKEKAKVNQSTTDENLNVRKLPPLPDTVPKSVAFDVNFGEPGQRPSLPRRLSSRLLIPLEGAPKLSYEMLLEKQRLAEEKRDKALEKNKKLSRKSSKRRLEIMKAKEFEKEQQDTESKDKVKIAEEKRLAKLEEVRQKQKMREERARRAREKVRRMSEQPAEEALTVEVEKDDNFNKDDDVDSWLNDDGDAFEDQEENVRKRITGARDDSGNYSTRAISASTTDSFDYAFQRQNGKPALQNGIVGRQETGTVDDFFDS